MGKFIFYGVLAYVAYHFFVSNETGCDKYASNYSCSYLIDKASYDVYYWFNVAQDDPNDERFIGNVTGLSSCLNFALAYANSHKQVWNNRSYICVLKQDGINMEKHRYIGN